MALKDWKKTLNVKDVVRYNNVKRTGFYLEITKLSDSSVTPSGKGKWEVQLRKDNAVGDVVVEHHVLFADNKWTALYYAKKYMEAH